MVSDHLQDFPHLSLLISLHEIAFKASQALEKKEQLESLRIDHLPQ
jgi:hypothetical protein